MRPDLQATREYLLGIDSGTQSVRVIVFDRAGEIVCSGSANHVPYFSTQTGWAEIHPQNLWAQFCQASREAMSKLPFPKERLLGAGITAQRNSVIFADQQGEPLRPAILWLDERLATGVEPVAEIEPWMQLWQLYSKANWVRLHEPEIHRQVHRYLTVTGWLTYKLTSEFNDAMAMHVGYWPLDVGRLSLSDDPKFYEAMGMPREKLANLLPPATVLGCVTPGAAEETGLPVGLPIVATAGDKQCETLGSGNVQPGRVTASYGTLSKVSITTHTPTRPKNMEYLLLPSAVRNAWHLEFQVVRGFWTVSWFRDQFGSQEVAEAACRGVSPERVLSEKAALIPPGSEGLVVAPYWFWQTIAPHGKGLIIGFDGSHTRAHVFRAILEGITFGLRPGLEFFQRDTGVEISEVVVGGGGAQSDLTMQMTADIFGIPAYRPRVVETCALGAAIAAAVALDLYPRFQLAVDHMTHLDAVYEPIPANQALYTRIYDQVYTKLYGSLEEIFINLRAINWR